MVNLLKPTLWTSLLLLLACSLYLIESKTLLSAPIFRALGSRIQSDSIQRAIRLAQKVLTLRGWKNVTFTQLSTTHPQVCHPQIGCLPIDLNLTEIKAMQHGAWALSQKGGLFSFFPFSPEYMKTKFWAYLPDTPAKAYQLKPFLNSPSLAVVNVKKRVVILTHGYMDNYRKRDLVGIKDALLRNTRGEVGTVIMVDWHRGSFWHNDSLEFKRSYAQAASNIRVVGRQIALLVNQLKKVRGLNPKKVYLVGHSLGAQTSGVAGRYARFNFHWTFSRITGLDPAGPLFYQQKEYLKKGDADFVDIIHTSAYRDLPDINKGKLGFPVPTGDLDFFPNGGDNQPQCPPYTSITQTSCVHQSALWYYQISLNATNICQFHSWPATNYSTFLRTVASADGAGRRHPDVVMGYYADRHKARGLRFLKTNKKYPYCERTSHSSGRRG